MRAKSASFAPAFRARASAVQRAAQVRRRRSVCALQVPGVGGGSACSASLKDACIADVHMRENHRRRSLSRAQLRCEWGDDTDVEVGQVRVEQKRTVG